MSTDRPPCARVKAQVTCIHCGYMLGAPYCNPRFSAPSGGIVTENDTGATMPDPGCVYERTEPRPTVTSSNNISFPDLSDMIDPEELRSVYIRTSPAPAPVWINVPPPPAPPAPADPFPRGVNRTARSRTMFMSSLRLGRLSEDTLHHLPAIGYARVFPDRSCVWYESEEDARAGRNGTTTLPRVRPGMHVALTRSASSFRRRLEEGGLTLDYIYPVRARGVPGSRDLVYARLFETGTILRWYATADDARRDENQISFDLSDA